MTRSSRKILGRFLRYYRNESGLSLRQAARHMDMSTATYQRLECANGDMSLHTVVKVLAWLARDEDGPE
jgi:transcriptional regulator with XRE-family HTH domain